MDAFSSPKSPGRRAQYPQRECPQSANAAGAIIGSKFVTLLGDEKGDAEAATDKLLKALNNE